MIETLTQFESQPEGNNDPWPALEGLFQHESEVAWQRVEHYTAWRFVPRNVCWLLDSQGGEWHPPLRPYRDLTARRWTGDGYETVQLARAPGGWRIPAGRYEISAVVGDGIAPAIVCRAVQRLAEYLRDAGQQPAGVRSYSINAGQLSESLTLHPNAEARAMQASGAADLLRGFRRVSHGLD
ncbi:MAG: hypothetical protein Q4G14_10370 [Paracoccus sp. (in: a-proteobacteria)]|uniref:hypothetical protein n=1 Tax=Paracoccus sp. TaxID=267 RepID=UPI0026E01BDC|nr:hypothetical protein [Paracoccus sp. (in: a-proteobacteria)]MDO5613628.1 hypothetical protein [Paracoccus sp. (in: a-proteobacteria)]